VPEPYLHLHPDTATKRQVQEGDWVSVETVMGAIRLRAKLDADLHPEVIVGEEGWWQACPELDLPGYDPLSSAGGNLNLILDDSAVDPLSGSVALRGRPCEVRLLDE
jgi:anaerobic selenocysteine-containing dehydrogenase